MSKKYDVFISYSSIDKNIADGMCSILEAGELRCWYAPRDINPGESWADSIIKAISETDVFVLIYSGNSNRSKQVLNEVTAAFQAECIIIPFRVEDVPMQDALKYYLERYHWLDAIEPPMIERFKQLREQISLALRRPSIKLSQSELTLNPKETKKLAAQANNPETDEAIIWTSDHPDVAAVDENGNVSWKGEGTAVITAQAGPVSDSCRVICQKPAARKNGRIAVMLVAVLAAALIGFLISKYMDNRGSQETISDTESETYTEEQSAEDTKEDTKEDTAYEAYENDAACFSVAYPGDYTSSEPTDTAVLISDGSDNNLLFGAEYFYRISANYTNYAVYSASDMADFVSENEYVLETFLGYDLADADALDADALDGRECFAWAIKVVIDDSTYEGEIYFTDGSGDFGCYALYWLVNSGNSADDIYVYEKACRTMQDSFSITGSYQDPSYTLYQFTDVNVSFLLSGNDFQEIEESTRRVSILPVEGEDYSPKIQILSRSAGLYDTIREEMNHYTEDYEEKENAEYVQICTEIPLGRYDCYWAKITYDDDGTACSYNLYLIDCGARHFVIEAVSPDEYEDQVTDVLHDILFSFVYGVTSKSLTIETEYYSVTFPASLYGMYEYTMEYVEEDSYYDAYYLRFAYPPAAEELDGEGWLFSITLYEDDSYYRQPEYKLLGSLETSSGERYNVVILYPTDVQYTMETEDGYRTVFDRIDEVLSTFTPADECSFSES